MCFLMKGLDWGQYPLGKAVMLTHNFISLPVLLQKNGRGRDSLMYFHLPFPVTLSKMLWSGYSKMCEMGNKLNQESWWKVPMCRALGDTRQTWAGFIPGLCLHFKCLHMGKCAKPSRWRSEYMVSVQTCQQYLTIMTVPCNCDCVYCSVYQLVMWTTILYL